MIARIDAGEFMRGMTEARARELEKLRHWRHVVAVFSRHWSPMSTTGKSRSELTVIANEALRNQPGCETARVVALAALPHARGGRNWEIPNVVLGDSLISDVDRAVITLHRRLGRQFHLLEDA
jgi:hypothetical protein